MHKGEWNGVLNDNSFAEIRAGQYGYDWTNGVNGTGLRYEDIGNNLITGRNRNWARERRRDQVLGSISYFKNGWGGNHSFKIGGEIFHETTTDIFIDGFEEEILHVLNNGVKTDVILFQPGESIGGLWTYGAFIHDTWRVGDKLTLNLGARLDRYHAFAPEQGHPTSRFNPTAQTFAAVENVITWNLPAPRLGVTYDLFGDGRTVLKANYGSYWFNPGADFVFNTSPNAPAWWRRYRWTDANNNNRWEPGEEGAVPTQTRGGARRSRSTPTSTTVHEGVRDLPRARADAELRRPGRVRVARPAQPVRAHQHRAAVLRLHRAGLGAAIPVPTAASRPPTMGRRLRRSIWRRITAA